MATREMILTEIGNVPDEKLDALYSVIKFFTKTPASVPGESLFTKLRRIKIDAPEDFAANFDLYMSGEKRIEDIR